MVDEDEVYGTPESNVPFNIYKNGQFLATETYSTNYIDPNGTSSDTYQVAPIVNGVEGEKAILSLRLQAARITLTFR